jgi:WhiB family redox-sensing transcriptional regulator
MTKRPEVVNLALKGKMHLLEEIATYPNFGPEAVCTEVDPDLFFSEGDADILKAKSICVGCPLVAACLDWAIRNEEFGVFGGTTPEERAALKRGSEMLPTSTIQAWKAEKASILESSLKDASREFGVNERTVLRWRQALEPERKAS